jgi:uncharacterized SAM-binding protein YcdF (DUF218 family)
VSWLTWKVARRVLLGILLVLVGYYLVTFVQVWRAAEADDARPSEAIIVLGAAQYDGRPSSVFKARLDHAFQLYDQGLAPKIVVTGGKQPGDRFTEGQAGANYLIDLGVPSDDILRETTSTNSWESLAASANFLRDKGIDRVILVSDPFHSLRIRLIAEELGFDPVTSPTRTSPISGLDEWLRYASEAVRVSFGRIFGFGSLARAGNRVGSLAADTVALGGEGRRLAILVGPSGVV